MTEAEWQACEDPGRMFRLVETGATERKCILFAVACNYLPPMYEPDFHETLKKQAAKLTGAVDYADGLMNVADIRRLWLDSGEDPSLPERGREWATNWAFKTNWHLEDPFKSDVTSLVRDIFGNPFRPVALDPRWRTADALGLARGIYEDRAFDRMPLLADALMDAGCDDEQIISHCHSPGPHIRGCWVVDLVLGKT
jgi:hypothetical protein